jgi:VanZ family protein
MTLIFVVSAQSAVPVPRDVSDKSLHFLAYMMLGVLVFRALSGGWPARMTRRSALGAMLITVAYGASDEVHQMFVPGRSSELADLYADAAGAAVGLVACWAWGMISVRTDV